MRRCRRQECRARDGGGTAAARKARWFHVAVVRLVPVVLEAKAVVGDVSSSRSSEVALEVRA